MEFFPFSTAKWTQALTANCDIIISLKHCDHQLPVPLENKCSRGRWQMIGSLYDQFPSLPILLAKFTSPCQQRQQIRLAHILKMPLHYPAGSACQEIPRAPITWLSGIEMGIWLDHFVIRAAARPAKESAERCQ